MDKITRTITPAIGSRFSGWLRLLRSAPGQRIAPRYWGRVAAVSAISLLSAPFQWYEDLRLARKLKQTRIHPSPVFIIGHWRSGTTFLHNLLSQDSQFGYVTTLQSIFPHSFMTNALFPALTKIMMPPTRPMDDMRLYLRSPQEEEMALVNYGPNSFYHFWHFPPLLRYYYRRLVDLEEQDPAERRAWTEAYLSLLRKATLNFQGRRLLLKSPANTGRIGALLELFPDARFIFLHRDPLEVYGSTLKLHRNVLPLFQLTECNWEDVRKDIIWVYKQLMSAYLDQRHLPAANQLVEISYEDLVNHPMQNLEMIYSCLELGDFAAAKPALEAYLNQKGIRGYRKAEYNLPAEEVLEVEREWGPCNRQIYLAGSFPGAIN